MEVYSSDLVSRTIGVTKPVLLIDVVRIIDATRAQIECTVDISYPFWGCHFVNNPTMPGTYMVEMLAQSAAFFETIITNCNSVPIITSIKNVRFLREVKPNQLLKAEIIVKDIIGNYYTTQGRIRCNDQYVCKAELVHYIKQ